MGRCTLYHPDGAYLSGLYQWDSSVDVVVRDISVLIDSSTVFFRFTNASRDCAITVEPDFDFDKYIVRIPNELLEEPLDITMYVYTGTIGSVTKTIDRVTIHVEPRQRAAEGQYSPTDAFIIADGLTVVGGKIRLTKNGNVFGTGATLP